MPTLTPKKTCRSVMPLGIIVLAALAVLGASPTAAHCKGKHDPEINNGVCPLHQEDSAGADLLTEGAVGHDFTMLLCNGGSPEGDIHDRGTSDGCELLECVTGNSVICGINAHAKPKLNISGLFHLWGADPDNPDLGQGRPNICFSAGDIAASFHVNPGTGGADANIEMYWRGVPDPELPGCTGTDAVEVKYMARIDACQLESGPFPPAVEDPSTVNCDGAPVEIRTEGGGKVAKKCGCTAAGYVDYTGTRFRFRIIDPL